MNLKGSVNTLEGPFSIEEDCICSMENPGFHDAKIKTSISDSLIWYAPGLIEKINIAVKYGFVTLTGVVPWMYQKILISSVVKNCKGVQGIVNNIEIGFQFPQDKSRQRVVYALYPSPLEGIVQK